MISLENLISSPDHYKNLLSLKNFQLDVNLVNNLGLDRKKFITESDSLKHRRNYVSKLIGDQKRKPTKEEISEMRLIGDKIKNIDKSINSLEVSITNYLLTIPNIPDEDVPEGLDESKNIEVKRFGELTLKKSKSADFKFDGGILEFVQFLDKDRENLKNHTFSQILHCTNMLNNRVHVWCEMEHIFCLIFERYYSLFCFE